MLIELDNKDRISQSKNIYLELLEVKNLRVKVNKKIARLEVIKCIEFVRFR